MGLIWNSRDNQILGNKCFIDVAHLRHDYHKVVGLVLLLLKKWVVLLLEKPFVFLSGEKWVQIDVPLSLYSFIMNWQEIIWMKTSITLKDIN